MRCCADWLATRARRRMSCCGLTAADIARSGLAERCDLPPDAAAVLAVDRDTDVRRALAANPGLPPEVQAVLAAGADWWVRAQLAEGAEYC